MKTKPVKSTMKQTPAGLIPKDWGCKPLAQLAHISSGGTPSRQISTYWGGQIPWVKTAQVNRGYISSVNEMITELGLKNSSARVFPAGTLLMALYGQGKTRGQTGILSIEAAINQACAAISTNKKLDTNYLFYNLDSRYNQIRNLSNTGNQENLSGEILKGIPIPLPPLPEQKKIAEVLTAWDDGLRVLSQLIDAKQEQKKALMQQLLTGKKRLPGFKGKWKKLAIKQLGNISKGKGVRKVDMVKDGFPAIRYADIYSKFNEITYLHSSFVSDLYAENHITVSNGAIIFAMDGETQEDIGKSVSYQGTKNCCIGDHTSILMPHEDLDSKFLGYRFNETGVRRHFSRHCQGSSVYGLRKKDLLEAEVTLPTLKEQQAIAQVLDTCDEELALLQQQKDTMTAQKRGLMQQLLTGKTRVKIN